MPAEMMRNYAVEASDLLTRWKRGEDIQDALAHQLRHVSAALNTLQSQNAELRSKVADAASELDLLARYGLPDETAEVCFYAMKDIAARARDRLRKS